MIKKLNFFLNFYSKEERIFIFTPKKFQSSLYNKVNKMNKKYILINNKNSFTLYIRKNKIHYISNDISYHF